MNNIIITLPDGSTREFPQGSTAMDVALSISEGLARNVLAAKVNGEVWDATRPINESVSLQLLTWKDEEGNKCSTQWSPFTKDTDYFAPSKKDFMFNYRVENLVELLKELQKEGVTIVGEMQEYDYGKFGWVLDNEGNKIELWEPKDAAFL